MNIKKVFIASLVLDLLSLFNTPTCYSKLSLHLGTTFIKTNDLLHVHVNVVRMTIF